MKTYGMNVKMKDRTLWVIIVEPIAQTAKAAIFK